MPTSPTPSCCANSTRPSPPPWSAPARRPARRAAIPGGGTAVALAAADRRCLVVPPPPQPATVLAAAELRGIRPRPSEHERCPRSCSCWQWRRQFSLLTKAAAQSAPHLGRSSPIPFPCRPSARQQSPRRQLATRYGRQRGVLNPRKAALGVGFAIGAGGNLFMAKGVIQTAKDHVRRGRGTESALTAMQPGPLNHCAAGGGGRRREASPATASAVPGISGTDEWRLERSRRGLATRPPHLWSHIAFRAACSRDPPSRQMSRLRAK